MSHQESFVTTRNPVDDRPLETYKYQSDSELMAALADAERAFRTFRHVALAERTRLLVKLAEVLEAKGDFLANLAVSEMGKPWKQARQEVSKCAATCRHYAEQAPSYLASQPVAIDGYRASVSFRPLGVILAIMPWNFPYWQVVRFAAPALAAGNACLVKHADNTTGCALALADVFRKAGFPDGIYQAIVAHHEQIPALIRSPATSAVSLTGSSRAGRAVASICGDALKKTVLELGGSDAYLVLADADLDKAASICLDARLVNAGQSCVAAKRFIIEEAVYDEFVALFVAKAAQKVVGSPLAANVDVGPLARRDLLEGVEAQVATSLAQGARLAYQSSCPEGGFFHPITVLADVTPGMVAFDDEIFGPVAAMIRARDVDEAIALANRSRFGLGGAILTSDFERGLELAERELDAGFCVVNTAVVSDPRLPFGGIKESGYGRELSSFGLREFVNVKTVLGRED